MNADNTALIQSFQTSKFQREGVLCEHEYADGEQPMCIDMDDWRLTKTPLSGRTYSAAFALCILHGRS